MDIALTDQNFEHEVLQSELPVLVDFWAPWCGPCKIVSPTIEELSRKYIGKIKVRKLNVDDNPQTAEKYGVMSIPTVIIFKNGQPVNTLVGAQEKENYEKIINEVLN